MTDSIAVVNTDRGFLAFIGAVLQEHGYAPHLFTIEDTTYPQIRALVPAAIVLDIPPDDAQAHWRLFSLFVQEAALGQTPVLLCIPDGPEAEARAAPLARAHDVLVRKPFEMEDVLTVLRRVVGR